MTTRMRNRKKPEPEKKSAPMAMGPMIGLMAVCLVAMACMYWWTSRHAAAPASLPAAPASVPATPSFTAKHIYSETANPSDEIAAALTQAKREHKRVIVDFGGDWCGDCQALDIYLHQAPNDALLETNFVLVHVWIGHMDANLDVAKRYGVPIGKGVPALAILDGNGTVLYAQKAGEFEDMRHMEPGSVTEFLERWKS
ncbi:MAG: thioredoxin family protein [Acidobacteriaceae bacterium]